MGLPGERRIPDVFYGEYIGISFELLVQHCNITWMTWTPLMCTSVPEWPTGGLMLGAFFPRPLNKEKHLTIQYMQISIQRTQPLLSFCSSYHLNSCYWREWEAQIAALCAPRLSHVHLEAEKYNEHTSEERVRMGMHSTETGPDRAFRHFSQF